LGSGVTDRVDSKWTPSGLRVCAKNVVQILCEGRGLKSAFGVHYGDTSVEVGRSEPACPLAPGIFLTHHYYCLQWYKRVS